MDKTLLLTLTVATTGIVILETMPKNPYKTKNISTVKENCKGKIEVSGKIIKTFYSEKRNYIGVVSGEEDTLLITLPENIFPGDRVEVQGRASQYREQCFIFPDEVKLR